MERFRNPPPKSHWQRCLLKVHGLQHVVFDEAWCCLGIVGPPSETEGLKNSAMVGHVTCTYYISISISIYIYITYAISKSCYDICIQHDVYRHIQLQVWGKMDSWHLLEASTRQPSRAGISTEVSLTFVDVAARWHGQKRVWARGARGAFWWWKACVYMYVYMCMYICACIYICSRLLKLRNPQNHGFQYSQIC